MVHGTPDVLKSKLKSWEITLHSTSSLQHLEYLTYTYTCTVYLDLSSFVLYTIKPQDDKLYNRQVASHLCFTFMLLMPSLTELDLLLLIVHCYTLPTLTMCSFSMEPRTVVAKCWMWMLYVLLQDLIYWKSFFVLYRYTSLGILPYDLIVLSCDSGSDWPLLAFICWCITIKRWGDDY